MSISGGHLWSFLVDPSAPSYSNNGRTNVPVAIIREHKPALQVKPIWTNQYMQLEECASLWGPRHSAHTKEKAMEGGWGQGMAIKVRFLYLQM